MNPNIPDRYKAEIKPEVKEEPKVTENKQTLIIKTELDSYIHDVMQTQPQTMESIKVRDFNFDKSQSRTSLPDDVKKAFEKRELAVRWINKDKRMIDRAIHIRGWIIVNRMFFPELASHYFTANGTIENGDSILGFMPVAQADRLRRRPGEISQERIKNLPIEKFKNEQGEKIGYYKPALTSEKDGEFTTVGIQPDKPLTNND